MIEVFSLQTYSRFRKTMTKCGLRSILGRYFYALESCWLIWLWNMNWERVQPKSDGLQPTSDGRHVANYAESTKKTARRLTVQTHEGCVALDISAVLHLPTYHMVLKNSTKQNQIMSPANALSPQKPPKETCWRAEFPVSFRNGRSSFCISS